MQLVAVTVLEECNFSISRLQLQCFKNAVSCSVPKMQLHAVLEDCSRSVRNNSHYPYSKSHVLPLEQALAVALLAGWPNSNLPSNTNPIQTISDSPAAPLLRITHPHTLILTLGTSKSISAYPLDSLYH